MAGETNDIGKTRLIAFFLTQFHPIPENDAWWGKGFTEWTNTVKAKPLFPGHHQPHLPADLGFYDLRLRATRHEQIALAKQYGIDGFCYHYYWFSGRRVLEQPLDDMLADPDSDMPFCLCWANENWTRRWDAAEHEVLLAQQYRDGDDLQFIADIAPILRDRRYIRHNGAALLIVYRPQQMPDPQKSAEVWRTYCRQEGIGDLHLCAALTHGNWDHRKFGFDSGVEFPPHNLIKAVPKDHVAFFDPFHGTVHDYRDVAEYYLFRHYTSAHVVFRTVFPSWDNTARRSDGAVIVLNGTPENYEYWLAEAIRRSSANFRNQERIVFINAWNEWAEGCHLEPDSRFGRRFLEATLRAKRGKTTSTEFAQVGIPDEARPDGESLRHAGRRKIRLPSLWIEWPFLGKNSRKELRRKYKKFKARSEDLQDEVNRLVREIDRLQFGDRPLPNAVRGAESPSAADAELEKAVDVPQGSGEGSSRNDHHRRRGQKPEQDPSYLESRRLSALSRTPPGYGASARGPMPLARREQGTLACPWAVPRPASSQEPGYTTSAAYMAAGPSLRVASHKGYRADLSRGTSGKQLPQRFAALSSYESAPQAFQVFNDVVLFTWMGAIMDRPGCLVEETIQAAIGYSPDLRTIPGVRRKGAELVFDPAAIGPMPKVDAPCLHAYHGSALAYGHWWFDIVPSLWLWRAQIARGEISVLLPRDTQPWMRAVLNLIGIPDRHCIETDADALHLEQCIVATACSISNLREPPPLMAEIGRELVIKVTGRPPMRGDRRLYLTRSRETSYWSRQLENDAEIASLLTSRGFDVLDPGRLSIEQQIEVFSRCETIVAPHGSALANTIFAPPGCRVVDLMPDMWLQQKSVGWAYDTTNLLNQEYVCLLGETTWQSDREVEHRSVRLRDRSLRFRIDPAGLSAALDALL